MTTNDEIKVKVLNYSLKLEALASYILGFVLDIKNFRESKSFGNKSTSLSFNQKLNLLLDYEAIEKDEKVKLDGFMNIRNQFMHNLDCKSFKNAFDSIDGLQNKFQKLYPECFTNDDIEKSLEKCIDEVFEDSFKILGSLKGGVEKKLLLVSEHSSYKKVVTAFISEADIRFKEIKNEVQDNKLDFSDKEILIQRIEKLKRDIFVESLESLKDK